MVVVVVSGKPLSGSSTLAKTLAERLGVGYFSAGEFYKAIATRNAQGHLTEAVNAFFNSKEGSSKELHQRIDEMQVDIARKGNVVVEGKLAIHFAGKYADLKVWVEAVEDVRVERLMKREGYGREKALKILHERDNTDRNQFKKIYGFDPWEQREMADIILDSSHSSPEELADMVLEELRKRGVLHGDE